MIFPPPTELEAGTCCRLIPYKCIWLFAGGIFQTKFWYGASARQPCNPSSKQAVICFFKNVAWKTALSLHACTNTHAQAHVRVQASSQQAPAAAVSVALSSACSSSFLLLKSGFTGGAKAALICGTPRPVRVAAGAERSDTPGAGKRDALHGILPEGHAISEAPFPAMYPHQHRTWSSTDTSIPGLSGQSYESSSTLSQQHLRSAFSPDP